MIFLPLINNIAILVAMSLLFSLISRRWDYKSIKHQIMSGLLFSIVSIIGMMNPLRLLPGIIFDGRSIIISVAGFFGGPITALITVLFSSAFRIWLGGSGVYMGVSVITFSALVGILYNYLRNKGYAVDKTFHLWIFSMIVHIGMLILTLALPSNVTFEVLDQIAAPVLILYPIGSLLVCLLFLENEAQIKNEEKLRMNESRLASLVNISQYDAKDINDLLDYALRESIKLTNSQIGYFYFYDEEKGEIKLNNWFGDTEKINKIMEPFIAIPLDKIGFLGEVIKRRQPIIINNSNLLKEVFSKESISLKRLISIPIIVNRIIVAVVELGNKSSDYDQTDLLQLQILMDTVWKIVEKKQTEESLKTNERTMRTLLSNLPGMAYRCLYEYNLPMKFVSAGSIDLTGYPPKQFLDNDLGYTEIIRKDFRDFVWKELRKSIDEKEPFQLQYPIITKDGYEKWVWEKGQGVYSDDGNLLMLEGIILDHTEYIIAEQKLRSSENQFREFLNSTDDFVFLKNANGKYLFVNKSMADFLERNIDEILGKVDSELMSAELSDKFRLSDKSALDSDDIIISEESIGEKIFESRKFKIYLENNKPAIGGFIRDVTEARKLEKQVIQSEKLSVVGQLAGGIAHDLNNILTVLVGNIEMLKMKLGKECMESSKNHINALMNASLRARNIILQILAFSRKQQSIRELVNLDGIVNDIQKMLSRLIPENISVNRRLYDLSLIINADISQIEQIIMNLVINARDAIGKSNGIIDIVTKKEILENEIFARNGNIPPGRYALLKIKDNGSGIPNDIIDRVFEPFFTTKDTGTGTGLGLAIVMNNVIKNDGFIILDSDTEKGTEFSIYFPLIDNEKTGNNGKEESGYLIGNNEKVLIVEDDADIRSMLNEYLNNLKYIVLLAENGIKALSILESEHPDLILTDITMPGMNGIELFNIVKKKYPSIPVIAMSGYFEQYGEIGNLGFVEILNKPLDMEKISYALNKIFRRNYI